MKEFKTRKHLRSFGFAIRKYLSYGFKILNPINPDCTCLASGKKSGLTQRLKIFNTKKV